MVMVQVLDSCEVSEFDCGDQELNSFIMDDAVDYHINRLAESYLLKDEGKTVAYVTLLNDRVSVDSFDDKTSFNRFRRKHCKEINLCCSKLLSSVQFSRSVVSNSATP